MNRSPSVSQPSAWTINVLVALLCVVWGSTWLVLKIGLADFGPYTGAGLRFLVAAVVIGSIAPWLVGREGGTRPPLWLSGSMGLLNLAVSYAIVYRCMEDLPSGLVSVLWAVFPLMMALGGHLWLGERLVGRQWFGFVLGFLGVVALYASGLGGIGWDKVPLGLFLLVSPFVCTVSTLLVKRFGAPYSSVLLNRDGLVLATVLMAIFAWFGDGWRIDWTPRAIGAIAYLAVFGTVVTFGLYFWLMRYAPANKLSLIAYVTPVIALGLGWLVRGEPVTDWMVFGSALILAGVFLVVKKRRVAAPVSSPGSGSFPRTATPDSPGT